MPCALKYKKIVPVKMSASKNLIAQKKLNLGGGSLSFPFNEGDPNFLLFIYLFILIFFLEKFEFIPELTLLGHTKKINRALWTELNKKIVTCSDEGTIRKWDVETGKEVKKLKVTKTEVSEMRFSPDKTMIIASSTDHAVRVI